MKKFRNYQPDQLLLLPPSLNEWLPDGHLVHFISDLIDTLDLSEIFDSYDVSKGGQPAYHPSLMVKLLVYGYSVGIYSSRQIEKATWEQIPFRVLSADQHPDHDSLAAFRKRHLKALSNLFTQVLQLANQASLVNLNHVAVDGSKVRANASKNKSWSLKKCSERETKIKESVDEILKQAEQVDKEEDETIGDSSIYQLPEEYRNRTARLKKIQELKAKIESEQQEIEEAKEKAKREKKTKTINRKPKEKRGEQEPKEEQGLTRNFTDYDSRIMRQPGGNWGQSYNAQIVVDSLNQIIIAADVTNECGDQKQLVPMLNQVKENTGKKPLCVLADAGYFSNASIASKDLKGIDLLVPPNKAESPTYRKGHKMFPPSETMREKLQKLEYKQLYRKRKTIVEPVFGQIKESVQRFNRFSLRGLEYVRQEWSLTCLTHNVLKLYRSGWKPA